MNNADIRILFCLLEGETTFFQIKAYADSSVFKLKDLVRAAKSDALSNFDANLNGLFLYQLKDPEPLRPTETLAARINNKGDVGTFGNLLEDGTESVKSIFPDYPRRPDLYSLHLFVKRPTHGLKRRGSSGIDSRKGKTRRIYKRWNINDEIYEHHPQYYVDPKGQQETTRCLTAVQDFEFLLLVGPRASGKTTRLLRLATLLRDSGFICLFISFHCIITEDDTLFWTMLSHRLDSAAEAENTTIRHISSQQDFLDAFQSSLWPKKVVILMDKFDLLCAAPDYVRDAFVEGLRELKNRHLYGVQSVVATGTFNILDLNPTNGTVSPFNVAGKIQNPNFSLEETSDLFRQFGEDNMFVIEDEVVKDIWELSSGHPGMVCLCGRIILDDITLHDFNPPTVTYRKWQQYSMSSLTSRVADHHPFKAMINALRKPNAVDALIFLRSYFTGYLDDVKVRQADISLADLLTTEGVLSKPSLSKNIYRISSPLVAGLVSTFVIPARFPNAPSMRPPLPYQHSGHALRVLDVLIESLEYFDKQMMQSLAHHSFKSPKVPGSSFPTHDVNLDIGYTCELMRILKNWLAKKWKITGKWHLRNEDGSRHSSIILKYDSEPIILEVLATGDRSNVKSRMATTLDYMALLSAKEAWVIHFTCEMDYQPIWQSEEQLSSGLNMAHFRRNLDFSEVQAWARWRDSTGVTQNFEDLLHI